MKQENISTELKDTVTLEDKVDGKTGKSDDSNTANNTEGNTQGRMVDGHLVKETSEFDDPDEMFNSLISGIHKYHPSTDTTMVEKAYKIAYNAQDRKSVV